MTKNILISVVIGMCVVSFIAVILDPGSIGRDYQDDSDLTPTLSVQNELDKVDPNTPPDKPQSNIRLVPAKAEPDSQGVIDLGVAIDTHNNRVNQAIFKISYDPQAIQFIDIMPEDLFYAATVLTRNVNQQTGTIEFSEKLAENRGSVTIRGNDHIAGLKFRSIHPIGTTEIKFIGATLISPDTDESVVNQMQNSLVNLSLNQ